jgi:hypothetical protein
MVGSRDGRRVSSRKSRKEWRPGMPNDFPKITAPFGPAADPLQNRYMMASRRRSHAGSSNLTRRNGRAAVTSACQPSARGLRTVVSRTGGGKDDFVSLYHQDDTCGSGSAVQSWQNSVMAALPEERDPLRPRAAERWYVPIIEFATHIIVGTSIFLCISVAAYVIHLATTAIAQDSSLRYYGLRTAETVLFVADTILFLVFISRTTWRTLRKLTRGWNE